MIRPSVPVAATVLLICLPSDGRLTLADLAAGCLVAVLAVRLIGGDRSTVRHGWLPFAVALAAFALATITATDVTASAVGFIRYAELFVLVPVAVAMSLRDRADVLLVAGAVVAVTLIEGTVGIFQNLTRTGASYGGQDVRAVGTFGAEQVLALGALIGYGLIVTLALAFAATGRVRVALFGASAFLLFPLGLTLSRGAWIATACAVLVLLVLASWRLAVALTFLVAALVMVGVPTGPDQRITSIVQARSAPDQSVRDRYALWHAALAIWADHPVTGVGLKDFVEYRDSYASVELSAGSDVGDRTSGISREPLSSAHNQYLMVLSEQGTVGIVAFGGLLLALAVGALRRRPTSLPRDAERFLDLAAPALMAWTLIDFLYGDIGAGPTSVLLAVLLGLVARRSLIIPATAGAR